jgi:molybdenum cofactor cytidylyltransferase
MDEAALAEVLRSQVSGGARVVVVAGETAIMDVGDLIPRGIRRAGGRVEHLGLAMDPGHLLLLADLEGIPVVGAPGCVRSPSPDGFHAVLPRLLAGEKLTRSDLQALGHGGLLSDPRKR